MALPDAFPSSHWQVNAALSDEPMDKLEYSLRQEMEQVVSVGARIASAMIK